ERQLFYLTCHPEVVEEFRRASEEVVVVDLSSLERPNNDAGSRAGWGEGGGRRG
ncbi:MAG: hypothetical protein IRY98_12775, partial [Alicyclobacillaceae bacterium]|nr:hypothetical protein [Alicyclobacillaceae bacterium]